MSEQVENVAPGVNLCGPGWRRVLKSGDPKGDDLRDAQAWVKDIRSRLAHIRGELSDLGKIEARMEHDRLCDDVAGTLTLALIALHRLVGDGDDRSFAARAERSDALWADVEANPDAYVIEDGESWNWHPAGIFERGGRPVAPALREVDRP